MWQLLPPLRTSSRSGAVDIPPLLDRVQQQLNRNVEVVTPAATGSVVEKENYVKDHDKKANHKSASVQDPQTQAEPR